MSLICVGEWKEIERLKVELERISQTLIQVMNIG